MINLSEVTIDYEEVIPTNRQGAEFYTTVNGHEKYATLNRGNRNLYLVRGGNMYLTIPNIENGVLEDTDKVIRYTDELLEAGITTDLQFHQMLKTLGYAGWSVYHENPYWEIVTDYDNEGIFCDSDFYEAIDRAIELLFNDDFWDNWIDEFAGVMPDCE